MPEQARVTSVDAIELFRSNLIIYLTKTRPAVDEVGAEIMRMRNWLEVDRKVYWETQIKRRLKMLESAQEALNTARMANLRAVTTSEQQAVRQAERAVKEAEEKLRQVKKWNREFDSRVLPLGRQLEKLNTLLTTALPEAVMHLGQVVRTLEAYSNIRVSAPAAPTGAPAADEGGKP